MLLCLSEPLFSVCVKLQACTYNVIVQPGSISGFEARNPGL